MIMLDKPNVMDGLTLLAGLPEASAACVFFDPQYESMTPVLRRSRNPKGGGKLARRCALPQMDDVTVASFLTRIPRILKPSGHLFLWMDKWLIGAGRSNEWLTGTGLLPVDLIVWDRVRMGLGYRSRRQTEFIRIFQKPPQRARGCWNDNSLRDLWSEKTPHPRRAGHPHPKPVALQRRLIRAVTNPGDLVVDPAAGTYSVMTAALAEGRRFAGADLREPPPVQMIMPEREVFPCAGSLNEEAVPLPLSLDVPAG